MTEIFTNLGSGRLQDGLMSVTDKDGALELTLTEEEINETQLSPSEAVALRDALTAAIDRNGWVPVEPEPEPGRTTKYLTGTFTAIFHGDYVGKDDAMYYFESWVDAGLDDRDDLRSWSFAALTVTEVTGDPEGYDS